jgi:beta-glucosidase-like glycosyl hydrolase
VRCPTFYTRVKRAVDVGVGSVMCACDRVNGVYSCNNSLLHDILQGKWGFDGFVVSDWLSATRSTVPAVLAGLDIEMPWPGRAAADRRRCQSGTWRAVQGGWEFIRYSARSTLPT